METPPRPASPAELLGLLQQQPVARLNQIAQRWKTPSAEPVVLYRAIVDDRERFEQVLLTSGWLGTIQQILVDMMQDFSLPVTLYPEDREARLLLAEWGFIYPCPAEWGIDDARHPQWSWTMPVEIAILCARVVPIFRPRLALMLGHLEDAALFALAEKLDVRLVPSHPERVLQLAQRLLEPGHLERTLLVPEWYDHLFTLQIVLEWHGLCHRQELFSFAWGDETLRPLTARDQQLREQLVEHDLLSFGLLFAYSPPPPDPYGELSFAEKQGLLDEEEGELVQLVVLPEELRPEVWTLSREVQEGALREGMIGLGGWMVENGAKPGELADEPVDRLKGLACVLEAHAAGRQPREAPAPPEQLLRQLDVELEPQGPEWASLLQLGVVTGALVEQPSPRGPALTPGRNAAQLLDGGAGAWCRAALDLWVRGRGPASLDRAQNLLFGLSAAWLEEAQALISVPVRRTPPLMPWWEHLGEPGALQAAQDDEEAPSLVRSRRRQRLMPSWLHAETAPAAVEVWCGNPRQEVDRPMLQRELFILEGVITTFRLLLLDVLSGLPTGRPHGIAELGFLVQDAAALALHLNLAVLLLDISGQTFIPVRPPSFLVEPSVDEAAEEFARALVEALLVPAGAAELTADRESFRLVGGRLLVDTPSWFDDGARLRALASLTGDEAEALQGRTRAARPLRLLRGVASSRHVESERRFWLGRPLEELRSAVAGRAIKALRAGYLELG